MGVIVSKLFFNEVTFPHLVKPLGVPTTKQSCIAEVVMAASLVNFVWFQPVLTSPLTSEVTKNVPDEVNQISQWFRELNPALDWPLLKKVVDHYHITGLATDTPRSMQGTRLKNPPPALASVFKLNTRRPTDVLLRCCHIACRVWPSITPTILIVRQFIIWHKVNWTELIFFLIYAICVFDIFSPERSAVYVSRQFGKVVKSVYFHFPLNGSSESRFSSKLYFVTASNVAWFSLTLVSWERKAAAVIWPATLNTARPFSTSSPRHSTPLTP